ncbi:hypothetical protein [Ruania zhangjianzhongii]|uniref:hypothetical protein n=1 Tax=Ruania zhangjianzhongii TaxID=2603206 RepID=UPI0011CAC89A|nr:hypothetical protein [Ruania zhangjianzhongii]
MTALTGEILPYLDAIGTTDGSEAMIAAMKLVGTKFTIDEYTSAGMHEKYLVFGKGGVDFLVIDDILDTIFFRLVATENGAPYARPEALIDGLHHGMSRGAVVEILGEPLRNEPHYLLYAIEAKFLNVQVRDNKVEDFSIHRVDVAAGFEDSPDVPVATPLTGEISLFIDAAGTAFDGTVMSDLIDAVGPGFDSHNIDDDQGTGLFLVFRDGGVDVQYRNGILTGVLIHITGDERVPYPRPHTLVNGLTLPATRNEVTTALGTPQQSLADIDLFHERGRHILFDYSGDNLQTISIVHVPKHA